MLIPRGPFLLEWARGHSSVLLWLPLWSLSPRVASLGWVALWMLLVVAVLSVPAVAVGDGHGEAGTLMGRVALAPPG